MSNIPGLFSGIILNNLVCFPDFIAEIRSDRRSPESRVSGGRLFPFSAQKRPVSVLPAWMNGCRNPEAFLPPDLHSGLLSRPAVFFLTSFFGDFPGSSVDSAGSGNRAALNMLRRFPTGIRSRAIRLYSAFHAFLYECFQLRIFFGCIRPASSGAVVLTAEIFRHFFDRPGIGLRRHSGDLFELL